MAISLNQRLGKEFQHEYKADLLDGVMVLHHKGGVNEVSSAKEGLYMPASPAPPKTRPENLTLIPYYAWSNRQQTAMQVWVPYVRT
jgi:DUF1680 family protein